MDSIRSLFVFFVVVFAYLFNPRCGLIGMGVVFFKIHRLHLWLMMFNPLCGFSFRRGANKTSNHEVVKHL